MDFTAIVEVLGLAKSAVGLTGQAATTIASIKKAFEGDEKPDNDKTIKLLNNLAAELTVANMTNVQLSTALKSLANEFQKEEAFEKEKARYELFETKQNDIVFRLRSDEANGQPIHFVCPVCLNRDKIFSFLGGDRYYKTCKISPSHGFDFENRPSLDPGRVTDFW